MGERIRSMMYVQYLSYCPFKSIDELKEAIENLNPAPERYGIILHDHDKDKETGQPIDPHFHVFMHFENGRSMDEVAKLLGDRTSQIENWEKKKKVKNPVNNGFSYLCHRTDTSRDKYQYDFNKVVANFDYVGLMNKLEKQFNNKMDSQTINVLLDNLYNGLLTKEELEKQLTGTQYAKYKRAINDISAKYLEREAEEWKKFMIDNGKHIQVIWIYGKAGVGKTRLAKHRAEQEGDYYMSGSSRDIFQNYAGQHTVILDELRPQSIPYGDLLRILDPFSLDTDVMAPSRYNDKPLAVGLFIITTPYNPLAFYNQIMPFSNEKKLIENNPDSFEQLLRRITLTIKVDENKIYQMQYDSDNEGYKEINSGRKNRFFVKKNKKVKRNSESIELYKSLF